MFVCIEVIPYIFEAIDWLMPDKFWGFIISNFKGVDDSFIRWRWSENSTTLNFSDRRRAKEVIDHLQSFGVENQILLRSYSSVSFLIRNYRYLLLPQCGLLRAMK